MHANYRAVEMNANQAINLTGIWKTFPFAQARHTSWCCWHYQKCCFQTAACFIIELIILQLFLKRKQTLRFTRLINYQNKNKEFRPQLE